jgi:hypothetical protein
VGLAIFNNDRTGSAATVADGCAAVFAIVLL